MYTQQNNNHPSDKLHKTCEWKQLFSKDQFDEISKSKALQNVEHYQSSWNGEKFRFPNLRRTTERRRGYGSESFIRVEVSNLPKSLSDEWENARFTCSCGRPKCVHMAAAMLAFEKEHGPWVVWENEYDYQIRKQREAVKTEIEHRRIEAQKIGTEEIPAVTAFKDRRMEGPVIFDMHKILSGYTTTPYAIHRMREVLKNEDHYNDQMQLHTDREGGKTISFRQTFDDLIEAVLVWGTLSPTDIILQRAWKARNWRHSVIFYGDEDNIRIKGEPLDEYELACISRLWDMAENVSAREVTDAKALRFFSRIREAREEESKKDIHTLDVRPEKQHNIELLPRIVIENGEPMLSFKIGIAGSRKYVLKDCYKLLQTMEDEGRLVLGKKDAIDFSKQTFCAKSEHLVTYIQRHRSMPIGGSYQIPLTGSRLDNFYDNHIGGVCELMDKTNHIRDELVEVGHTDISFTLTADRLSDSRGTFMGIAVSGFVPVLISGSSNKYMLNREALSRISNTERKVLDPFVEVADASGYFRFQVGIDKLQEFYYRVIPGLLDNPFVEFIDNCEEESAGYLPPEPEFSFYLDIEDGLATLKCKVNYDEDEYDLTGDDRIPAIGGSAEKGGAASGAYSAETGASSGGYRDADQEARVLKAIQLQFPRYSREHKAFVRPADDDFIYDFLTAGISSLEFYGTVSGSSAFRAKKVISSPKIQLGISVDDGEWLMDLSLTSRDLTPKELLAVYKSYSMRKRYYKLKSGDYVDLTENNQFGEMDALLGEFGLNTSELINSKKSLPLFRALYLNNKLQERETLVASRDRTFRALIRSYKTVSESDFEVPHDLEKTLREYQIYGYKWLRTLRTTGFGGILADEMGLGKTIQMISLMESIRAAGEMDLPSIVVCPASLVYNWQEEIHRFAPDLKCEVVAGTAGVRKKMIADLDPAVYITSYDLLKRDIQLYEGTGFDICVIDEAQYIKNAGAAASKAVKLIHAKHRFALTGTPIENRLSELWSIFDFLMPGFLYDHRTFEQRFERPITKEHDHRTAERLREMTSPFILRRKKADVLKDLPDKLEEVRYARIGGEQQRLYDAQVLRLKGMLKSQTEKEADGGVRYSSEIPDAADSITGTGTEKIAEIAAGSDRTELAGADRTELAGADRTELADADRAAVTGPDRIAVFAELTKIRQICCDPSLLFEDYRGESAKREACLDLVRSAIEGGHRMLIFSQFVSMLELLEKDLQKEKIEYYKITGSTSKEKRISMVRAFNEGDVPVFLVSLKAGGTGLNLTGADVVIHYDPWWNLAVQNQATDRAHRIGQERQVSVYKLILKDTIEERIMNLQNAKMDLAESILEGDRKSLFAMSADELLELLQS